MAKISGLGAQAFIAGIDLSGDIAAVNTIRGSHLIGNVTAVSQSAMDRLALRRDGDMGFSAFFNAASAQSHLTLSALPRTDVQMQVLPVGGATAGLVAAAMVAKQADYVTTSNPDGSLVATAQGLTTGGNGLEWGVLLTTGKETMTGAASGSDVDDLAGSPTSTNFGCAAYMQVFALTGTSATVTIQHGATTGAGYGAVGAGLAFAAATGVTSERIVTASATENIKRYLRVSVAGTFSSFIFSVVLVRYRAAVS